MRKAILMLIRHIKASPGKILLTLVSTAFGTAVLILSFSISSILEQQIETSLDEGSSIFYIANGFWSSDGSIDQERPSQWDSEVSSYLVSDSELIREAALVSQVPFDQITVEGTTYTLRSAIATDTAYLEVFGLPILEGSAMSSEDIELGAKKIWLSEQTAIELFGSAELAVGSWVQPPGVMGRRGLSSEDQNIVTQYIIAGVYSTPSEIARRSYGVSDAIIPYTAILPQGMNAQMARDMFSGTLVVRSVGSDTEKNQAIAAELLTAVYGEDLQLISWEGSLQGSTEYMDDLRDSVDIFQIATNLLGIIIMIVSSLGIFSIMVVEALGRVRSIALERALGATRGQILLEFWQWSIVLSLLGAALGTVLALGASDRLFEAVLPLVSQITGADSTLLHVSFPAAGSAILIILFFGGVLGMLPAIPVIRQTISDTLQEAS